MSRPMRSLETQIQRIKQELATLGDLRPGNLSQQFNVCGKLGCRCKADPPRRHGPYFQISYTWQGRSHTQFVRKDDLPTVEQQLQNYLRLRELLDEWIEAGIALSQLRINPQLRTTTEAKVERRRSRNLSPKVITATPTRGASGARARPRTD
jgi:hypothetical protein